MTDNTSPRRLPPNPCTWCGHSAHELGCKQDIRLGKGRAETCTCRRHEGSAA